ncbi:MAG: transposase [Candidatus Nomurabacteria bacterium]|nr:transposase [Candidatus Nomurabacteria bacterium]
MSLRKVKLIQGEYFHLYNRGNDKKVIFKDKEDYERFVGLMYACNQTENFKADSLGKNQGLFNVKRKNLLVNIGAYCLMPNHFHILIIQVEDEGISKFMKKLLTAYVMYFNKKYERTGSLFEGKFKAEHAGDDRYLKYLYSYIHLNSIKLIDKKWKEDGIKNKNNALEYLNKYKYSSYFDYLGENRVQNKVLNMNSFPQYFSSKKAFKNEIFEWLSYKD